MSDGRGRRALVTGASSGIGRAFAGELASRGFDLILVARRLDRLERAAVEIRDTHGVDVQVLTADLADASAPSRIADEVRSRALVVDVFVSSAGYGVTGTFERREWAVHRDFLQVMVTAGCELTHLFLPGMIERRWGRIVHLASLAGHLPAPAGHTLYAASKAFVIRFAEALHAEHARNGVHTTAVCPGFTFSEFHDITVTRAQVSRMPRWMWMDADTVARQGMDAVARGQAVLINGRANRAIVWLARVMPQGVVRRVVSGSGKRFRKVD
jgi:short-subunit dehydrogenase